MIEYGSTIRLQHEYAMRFFEEAMNPDMEELRQRDVFLRIWSRNARSISKVVIWLLKSQILI